MMSCRELVHLVAEGRADELSVWRRLELRLHLRLCPGCRHYARQVAQINDAVRRLYTDDLPGDDALLRDLEAAILDGSDRDGT